MKLIKLFAILALSSAVVFLNSCSDSSTDPDDNDDADYYPYAQGSIWTYSKFDLDMDNNQKVETETEETHEVTGSEQRFGREATVVEATEEDGQPEKNYYDVEGNEKFWVTADFVIPSEEDMGSFPLPIDIPEAWIVLADRGSDKWDMMTIDIPKFTTTIEGFNVEISGTLEIDGESSGKGTQLITGTEYDTEEYRTIYKFNLSVKSTDLGATIPVEFTLVQHYWFADGVGISQMRLDSKTVNIDLGIFGSISEDIEGNEAVLTSFTIASE